jgi:hypothetical protein
MTKGRAVPQSTVAAEQVPLFITLGRPKAHDSSGEKHSQGRAAEPQISTEAERSGEISEWMLFPGNVFLL